jgi:hypothetical protein
VIEGDGHATSIHLHRIPVDGAALAALFSSH